jgi:two-component system, chemotaxis family, CheB/CheR fusion protein
MSDNAKQAESDAPRAYVAIGASAGGLEALRALIGNLPSDTGFAVVVAQHLAPQHASMLAALLSRESRVPIEEARDGVQLAANRIYITPPNCDISVRGNAIVLQRPHADRGPKPSVNVLFESIAKAYGPRAIAIVLSGTGTDGAAGIRAIKAAGGLAIVQNEESAKYNGMPQAAIDTGVIDVILPPDAIGAQLPKIADAPRDFAPPAPPVVQLSDIDEIFSLLNERHGIDLKNYKPGTVQRRVESRMAASRMADTAAFLALLRAKPNELDRLAQAIMIPVTSFFRDPEVFDAFSIALDALLASGDRTAPLRVWIPGCSTGEEAYSIAISIVEALERAKTARKVQIFATDIDEEAIAVGRRGIYPYDALTTVDPHLVQKYFVDTGEAYQVAKEVRERLVFAKHNLLRQPPFLRIDIVSCRNLLIYFKAEVNAQLIALFHRALRVNGLLLLGKSETLGAHSDLFEPIDRKAKLSRRRDVPAGAEPSIRNLVQIGVGYPAARPRVEIPPRISTQTLIERSLAEAFAPKSVLVDENLTLLQAHGDVARVLQITAGKPDLTLAGLVTRQLGTMIRMLVHKARRENIAVEATDIDPETGKGVRVAVRPVPVPGENLQYYLVSFLDTASALAANLAAPEPGAEQVVVEIRHELAAAREHLQTVTEELETANEELQSANEELQSANEELQSTNEELETSNEELQSTNEELQTINEELEQKSSELHEANTDLVNIQNSIAAPLVVVDRVGRVRRFNSAAAAAFGLTLENLADGVSRMRQATGFDDLAGRIDNVLQRGRAFERQVSLAERDYQLSIVANRDDSEATIGALLFFYENTEAVRSQRVLKEQETALRALAGAQSAALDGVPAHLALVDAVGRIVATNKAWDDFARLNGLVGEGFGAGSNYVEVCRSSTGDCAEEAHDVASGLSRVLAGELAEFSIEYPCHSPDQQRWYRCTCRPVWLNGARAAVVSHIDISDRKLAEITQRAAESKAREEAAFRERFLADASREMRAPLDTILGISEALERAGVASIAAGAHDIHDSAEHLLDFVARMFDLSQLDAGPGLLRESDGNPGEIARSVVRMLEADAGRRGHRLSAAIARDLPRLRCDTGLVRQMLLNLVGNAVRFSPPDSLVSIHIRERDGQIEISVRDGGPGFSADEVLKRRQAGAAKSKNASARDAERDGSRSLALVQTLAKLHGAELKLTSRIGEGAVATLVFPPERTLRAAAETKTASTADD